MHKLLTGFAALLLLAGCVSAQNNRQAQFNAYSEQLRMQRDAGQITATEAATRWGDARRSMLGADPFSEELISYNIYLAAEVDAGRMTMAQKNYLVSQKQSEIVSKLQAMAQQAQQPQETPLQRMVRENNERQRANQPSTYNTNCSRDGLGNTTCTTQRY